MTKKHSENSGKTTVGESYGAFVRRQFAKRRLGVISLYFLVGITIMAALADFLANDKPLVASYKGETIFPVAKQYAVALGLAQWHAEFATADWKLLKYDWAVFPPVPYSPANTDTEAGLMNPQPSAAHWLGVDGIGRDVLAGVIHGSRYALAIGVVAMGIALLIGLTMGSAAGFFGGAVDVLISRIIEIVITFPTFFLIITVVAMFREGSIWLIMALIGFTNWTNVARLIRGEVLRLRNLDFISAATALGYSQRRIIFRHILPNAVAPVLVSAAFGVAGAILIESALSFLGFGVPPTVVTWGSILYRASQDKSWWLAVFPGLMIFLTVSAYNLIGDALRDATDPRLRT